MKNTTRVLLGLVLGAVLLSLGGCYAEVTPAPGYYRNAPPPPGGYWNSYEWRNRPPPPR